jgi:hypothetical protein
VHHKSELKIATVHLATPCDDSTAANPVGLVVASGGRHTWSHPQLPLASTKENPEVILRKGKAPQGESFASKLGISPPPSVKTPFSYSHLPGRPSSEVSRSLNFGSVPAEFSPPGLVSEGEILVTPPSLEVVPQYRPQTSEGFITPPFTATVTSREASAHSGPFDLSLFFPIISFENLFSNISHSYSFSS